jgi:hypothetical protein
VFGVCLADCDYLLPWYSEECCKFCLLHRLFVKIFMTLKPIM